MAALASPRNRSALAVRTTTIELGLVIPLQGPAGIFGPSCEACARLAAEELNLGPGVLGRELNLVVIDGGQAPQQVAAAVGTLVSSRAVDAITGWHTSAVRQAVVQRVAGSVPYVYGPLYEGGERSRGVFLVGETPGRQVLPGMRWLARHQGVRRWCIVGDDYVWPRVTAAAARRYAAECGGQICDQVFVPLGSEDFRPVIRRVASVRPHAVLMLLVGQDAVLFNRAFAQAGLDARCLRFSPLMEENMLLASGADNTRGLYSSAGYFDALPTGDNLDFHALYVARCGPTAPTLGSLGESCYEGVMAFAALAQRAGSLDPDGMTSVSEGVSYDSPRGLVRMRDRHLEQRIYLAEANGLEFEIIARL
ncbi:MAG TPA: substrate-binding domain-containing protein [Streptosporangiaceae bacterium]|nr:substrate-binding domain-containing protein [Streptosporangiaceae bacterium]